MRANSNANFKEQEKLQSGHGPPQAPVGHNITGLERFGVLLLVLQSAEQGEDGGLQQSKDPLGRCCRAITVPCYRENLFFTQQMSDYIKSGISLPFNQWG